MDNYILHGVEDHIVTIMLVNNRSFKSFYQKLNNTNDW